MTIILAITLLFASLLGLLSLRRKQERLNIFSKVNPKKTSYISTIEAQLNSEHVSIFREAMQKIIRRFKVNVYLLSTDATGNSDVIKLIGLVLLGCIAGLILNYIYLGLALHITLIISVVVTLLGTLVIKKRRLKKHFYDTFPEALSIITGTVAAGLSMTIGFRECANRVEGAVGNVLKEVSDRIELGDNVNNVLLNSYQRLPFPEYYFFVLTVMVNMDSGGELKEILSRLTKMLANNRILAKNRDSKTAELRMTVIILTIIPFAFILLLRFISKDNYEYLMYTDIGNGILYYVVGSVFVGISFIRKMISRVV